MKITESAVSEIGKILNSKEMSAESTYLRVGISGSRCSGPNYSFNLDTEFDSENDVLMVQDGLKIINNKIFSEVLEPVVIDYTEIGDRKGFSFSNPLAVVSGGCCGGGSCSSGGSGGCGG